MYYLVIVQNENTQAIYSYATEIEATAAFHTELAYRAEGRTSTKCTILDNDLLAIRNDKYVAPVTEPNTEEPQEG